MDRYRLILFCVLIWNVTNMIGQTGQETTKYFVDSSIRDSVEKQIQQYKTSEIGRMYMKWYVNDSLKINTYETPIKENLILIMSYISNDTIYAVSSFGMFGEFGFYLELFNDSCRIFHFASRGAKINLTDLKYTKLIPCTYNKLTLSKKSTADDNEIEYLIELTSTDYYQKEEGLFSKYKLQLKAYFKTKKAGEQLNTEMKKHIQKQLKISNS